MRISAETVVLTIFVRDAKEESMFTNSKLTLKEILFLVIICFGRMKAF